MNKIELNNEELLLQLEKLKQENQSLKIEIKIEVEKNNQFEQKLIEIDQKSNLLFDTMSEGVALNEMIFNDKQEMVDYRILEVNKAFYSTADYSSKEVINSLASDLYSMSPNIVKSFWLNHKKLNITAYTEILSPLNKKHFYVSTSPFVNGRFVTVFFDITLRKKAEEALKKSEEMFKFLVLNLQIGVLIQGPKAEIILSNQKALELLGLSEQQLLGKSSFDPSWNVIHQDGTDFPGNLHPVPLAIATKEPIRNVTMGVYRPTLGDRVWLLVNAEPHLNSDGSVQQVVCTFTDITERKKIEKNLRESEEKFKALYKNLPIMYFTINSENIILSVNQMGIDSLGYSEMELVGSNVLDLFYDEDKSLVTQQVVQCFENPNTQFQWELRKVHKNGSILNVHESAIAINDINNRILLVACVDITKSKEIENKLRESEQFLQETQQITNIGNYNLNVETGIWESSIVLNEIFGISEDFEKTVDSWTSIVHPDWQLIMTNYFNEEVIGKRIKFEKEYKIIRQSDKTERWVYGIGNLKFDSNNQPVNMIGTIRDITERKNAEEEIKKKNIELAELNSSKDKFFSIIAHDLKSPFSGLLGLTKIMSENSNNFTIKELQELSTILHTSSKNLYKLLDNLLVWARMQSGLIEFNPENLLISELVELNLDIYSESAKQKEILFINNISIDTELKVDRDMINTVFRNLISNAIKFTHRGGKIEIGSVSKHSKKTDMFGSYTEIYVKDNGTGMDKSTIDNLFKIEHKESRPGTEEEPSTGLGLLLCKDFIEKHNGKLWIKSKVGLGSTFYFTLPDHN
ncbi:MAG: PAS domain-containing sensor histidine kinase [Candidatus Kapabacteria bacterium]|nr:PAS domain-containing sensor histidine kinase [Candidatus Kapabacteria bacterium]